MESVVPPILQLRTPRPRERDWYLRDRAKARAQAGAPMRPFCLEKGSHTRQRKRTIDSQFSPDAHWG